MRRFHSYGPVDDRHHFCVERKELVKQGLAQLLGIPAEGGYYFTIWAPRQRGKTWLMRQLKQEIAQRYDDTFAVVDMSLGDLRGLTEAEINSYDSKTVPETLSALLEEQLPGEPTIKTWQDFRQLFSKEAGLWDRPLILFIDEFDTAPPALLDLIVGRFRELYLHRKTNWLHGLALIGVRAVLGLNSKRGSPFNIQRSLHVPNLTRAEVEAMYAQYQTESGQKIEAVIVEKIYDSTRGQPGLISWFGELLTEKYNPGLEKSIGFDTWELLWLKARFSEPNNAVLNIMAKARDITYQNFLTHLFAKADIPFIFHNPLYNQLYMHGIIEPETVRQPNGVLAEVCRFSSPFVQDCLFHALSLELIVNQDISVDQKTILALAPTDTLSDVFANTTLNLPALLERYKDYLTRLKAENINPWKEQPRRKSDHHLTEAVGHFHLFAWLQDVIGRRCVVSPEFPTGNGKVDLHLSCAEKQGIIEIKSFRDAYQLEEDRVKAAEYAHSLGWNTVTMAVFAPIADETVLEQLSEGLLLNGIQVHVVAIGWT